jgi:hypothetical protein
MSIVMTDPCFRTWLHPATSKSRFVPGVQPGTLRLISPRKRPATWWLVPYKPEKVKLLAPTADVSKAK